MEDKYFIKKATDEPRNAEKSHTEYVLSPSVPEQMREKVDVYWSQIDHLNALGYIKPGNLLEADICFDLVENIMSLGDYEWALAETMKELKLLQRSRSVDGFQTKYARGIDKQIVEQTTREEMQQQYKKSWFGRSKRTFGKKQEEER